MKVTKLTTTIQDKNINEVLESVSMKDIMGADEQVETFTDFRIRENYPHKNLTLLYDLIKSPVLSEVPEDFLIDILKGKSYIKKKVTVEYLVIQNDGEDLTERIDDDWINYLSCENPEDLPKDKRFYYQGDRILNETEWENRKSAALKSNENVVNDDK